MKNEYSFIIDKKAPTVNEFMAVFRGRRIKTKICREFKIYAQEKLKEQFTEDALLNTVLKIDIKLYFKDKRKRDVDNYLKAIFDSLTGAVIEDDSLIKKCTVEKFESDREYIEIKLTEV